MPRLKFGRILGEAKGRAWEDGEHHGAAPDVSIIEAGAPKDLGHRNASENELHEDVKQYDYHYHGY
jgi:hypothetical protein